MSIYYFGMTSLLLIAAADVEDSRGKADLYDLAFRIANEDNQ